MVKDEPATEANYEPPQKFDTKQYVRQMVGPEGVNMSLVDKSMFGAGGIMPNMTKESLRDFVEAKVLADTTGLVEVKGEEKGERVQVEVVGQEGRGSGDSRLPVEEEEEEEEEEDEQEV